jgi:hypothetical protein
MHDDPRFLEILARKREEVRRQFEAQQQAQQPPSQPVEATQREVMAPMPELDHRPQAPMPAQEAVAPPSQHNQYRRELDEQRQMKEQMDKQRQNAELKVQEDYQKKQQAAAAQQDQAR